MILHIFSIYDAKVQVYHTPWFVRSQVEAVRTFQNLVNDNTSMIAKYPSDYSLYCLGAYDDLTAEFTHHSPDMILSGEAAVLPA